MGRPMEARLQTATSSGDVYSIISVHRLEHLMVPRFFWLLLILHASCRRAWLSCSARYEELNEGTDLIEYVGIASLGLGVDDGLPELSRLEDSTRLARRLVHRIELHKFVSVDVREPCSTTY